MNIKEVAKQNGEVFQTFTVPIKRKDGAQKLLQSKIGKDAYYDIVTEDNKTQFRKRGTVTTFGPLTKN